MKTFLISLTLLLTAATARAACRASLGNGAPAPVFADALSLTLNSAETCPTGVDAFKTLLRSRGLNPLPSMVANRGRHNPALGSFSFFERVVGRLPAGRVVKDGEFFFGHFTEGTGGTLRLAQEPTAGALLIELIAWDAGKGLFNFYELIGTGGSARWFYRGDSADIWADNSAVHLTTAPVFGSRLRCSACHASGGPILKEIEAPFNDWWTKGRPLPLGPNRPDMATARILNELRDVGEFAASVKTGIGFLQAEPRAAARRSARSWPERLRPLFCENEINLASDVTPLEAGPAALRVPPAFVTHPFLAAEPVTLPKSLYLGLLNKFGSRFPETNRVDADHGFLTPVRSHSDELALAELLQSGAVDEEFLADVLAVDFQKPLFSTARCSLLRAVPAARTATWRADFLRNLDALGTAPAAELREFLTNPAKNLPFHRQTAREWRHRIAAGAATPAGAELLYIKLLQTRQELARSPISQNPRGRILEPGFRVIFPVTRAVEL